MGKTNRKIAELLSISPDSGKFHPKGIYQILEVSGVSSRAKAIKKARQVGLLTAYFFSFIYSITALQHYSITAIVNE